LECCLLKMMALLIDRRFRNWMDSKHILPDSQNGFREGYRTTNCAFILRCAIDNAAGEKLGLAILFVDLQNTFPSSQPRHPLDQTIRSWSQRSTHGLDAQTVWQNEVLHPA